VRTDSPGAGSIGPSSVLLHARQAATAKSRKTL